MKMSFSRCPTINYCASKLYEANLDHRWYDGVPAAESGRSAADAGYQRYSDLEHVPGPSNYPDAQQQQQYISRSARNPYAAVPGTTTSISAMSRRPVLQRQHRSMDGLGVIDNYNKETYDLASHHNNQYDYHPNAIHKPSYIPLEISTSSNYPPQQFAHRSLAALSNPIPTQNAFWQQQQQQQNSMATDHLYDVLPNQSSARLSTMNGGININTEYEQLKLDYTAAIEKLNQTMNSIKTFWSPELKRERQMRREEATRINQLERIVSHSGASAPNSDIEALQLRMDLKEREERIRQLSAALENSGTGIGIGIGMDPRVRELEDTIMRLQDLLATKETQAMMNNTDHQGRYALEGALRRIDEKQARIVELEEELMRQRMMRTNQPRDFTDKNLSGHEMTTMRMKMERSEVELAERKSELMNCQNRMQTAEETSNEMRSHVQLLKDQLTNREQHNTLLQGDVDALRQKLDSKNKQLEQQNERIQQLERDINGTKADVSDKTELIRQTELKTTQLIGRIDGLETSLREKDQELDRAKIRLLKRQRLQEHIDQIRRNSEKEHIEQQKTYQKELQDLRSNIENLQKELGDRDILLESQNEKIGDMNRDLSQAKKRLQDAQVDKGTDELRKDVEAARNEVEKLLKMVHQLEKENLNLTGQLKQLSANENGAKSINNTLIRKESQQQQSNYQKRVEELEEALRESVSITAEREIHLSQQKHHLQQVSVQLQEARKEISEMRKTKQIGSEGGVERDQMIRAIETERRQHLEQLFQLKQEALLAAISEKDTHLALLEKARGPRDEIETLRRHKDALIRKLKQENERRALVSHPDPAISMNAMASVLPGAPLPAPLIPPVPTSQQHQEHDDTDGIWA
ncbi:unnamed protein product [Caenorhabditis angaria]|uniref:Uncharacterized protein n=1 Tax=Caenorhabditis angaria TaxID=860376 RepID=A0A9P1IR35_9PELO|nr:unnamed protein product [Caenorhabditis angaria]